jgi:threonine dehydrogenase-like Zn-dependent dehydrogenase
LRDHYDIAVEERPDPVPGSGQAVVEAIAAGICVSDFHGYSGENGRRHPGQIMGHETAGLFASSDQTFGRHAEGTGRLGEAVGGVLPMFSPWSGEPVPVNAA